jgi:putative membrane protein (TIGR04086 family)
MKKRIFTYIFSTACGALAAAIMVLLLALVSYILGFKRDMAGGMAFAALTGRCFVSGLICGLIRKRGGLISGAVCAAAMLIPLLLISLFTGGFSGSEIIVKTASMLTASCTGAVIGVNRRTD